MYGDRHDGNEPVVLSCAKQLNIKTVIAPLATCLDKQELVTFVSSIKNEGSKYCDVTNETDFLERYPEQILQTADHRKLSYYPRWLAKARHTCGVLPQNPWFLASGLADEVCVSGEAEKDRYVINGVSPESIFVTGRPDDDDLFEVFTQRHTRRLSLFHEYELASGFTILIALPPLLEHGLAIESEHWEVQKVLCEAAKFASKNVLISLHPKMRIQEYQWLETDYNVRIVTQPLTQVLPLVDLYIVGQGSSTVTWAVLCEIPLIIADWYGLNYDLYNWVKGKLVIRESMQLKGALMRLASEPNELENMKQEHRGQKLSVSPFDGYCCNRIFESL